jgi:hypothetical protein
LTQVFPTGSGPLVYDSHRARTVLYSERWQASGGNLVEIWEWDGTLWTQRSAAGAPPARSEAGFTYDDQRGRAVLFGGVTSGNVRLDEVWELGVEGFALAQPFAAGCGTPPLRLESVGPRPVLGQVLQLEAATAPQAIAFLGFGWSRTVVSGTLLQLPLPLASFGMPGCELLHSGEQLFLLGTATAGNRVGWGLTIPNTASLVGLPFYLQASAPAPGQNPAQLILSNGLAVRLGNV